MYGIKPLPHGTAIKPWIPDLIQIPVSRAFERVGCYLYNRVIFPSEIGLLPKNYNPRIHGPYCRYRWYGKQDTKLMDVKLCDLPAWFSRREKSIGAFYNEFHRVIFLMVHNFMDPVFVSPIRTIVRFFLALMAFMWCFEHRKTWDFRQSLYHW